jgi:hypothetical protein
MNKLRQVPIFTIEGTSFLVDVDKQVLRQTNDQDNEISFINNMQDHGTFYRLLYDLNEKRAAEDLFDQNRVKVIDVPRLTELDPEGMSAKYGISEEQLKGKTDFEVIVDQELLQQRLNGQLPKINIAGEDYIIDLRLQELRPAKDFSPAISLRYLDLSADGEYYLAYFHPAIRQVVPVDPKLTELPDGVIQLQIPNELRLDPIAMARKYGMEENEVLRRYPIQKNLKADVIPLHETGLPALIQRNREQLQKEHAEIARRIRPRHRQHF